MICTGDLTKYEDKNIDNDLDTKDNPIIVLKSSDYDDLKLDILTNDSTAIIGESYIDSGYIYLKYDLEENTNSNKEYKIPFVIKANIDSDTEIIGSLENGKNVEVQYKEDLTVFSDELTLRTIEVIED